MKIIYSSNISWSIYNFRKQLLKSLQDDGFSIYTISSRDSYTEKLLEEGFFYDEIDINNNSKNPFEDVKLLYQYYKLYKKINPDIICHNAIKPNIYGTIAASLLNIPILNNISGLGTLFIKKSFSTKIAILLYRYSQRRASKVIFQNKDDYNLFIENNLIDKKKGILLNGSGVNTDRFKPVKKTNSNNIIFLFIGRLIFDKGIREYVEAARKIKHKHKNVHFKILGPFYKNNETAVSLKNINSWINEGVIEYLGQSDNVEEFIGVADCIVLPSYREGLSKVLIEASSMGKPIVTTNTIGCRDVVIDNKTGFLCEIKNSDDLAEKIEMMIKLPIEQRMLMGQKARERAIKIFDEKIIIKKYKEAIYSIIDS